MSKLKTLTAALFLMSPLALGADSATSVANCATVSDVNAIVEEALSASITPHCASCYVWLDGRITCGNPGTNWTGGLSNCAHVTYE